ncbi:MAG: YdcF family protein [Ruminococcaceae bacterium]|nr:YdcF family protein [Oscillospiraceae bacterium]
MAFSRIKFTKIKKYSVLSFKILCCAFMVLCLFCGLVPLFLFGHFNPGNISLIIYAVLLFAVLFPKNVKTKNIKIKKILFVLKKTVAVFLAVCFLTGAFVSVFMIEHAFFNEPSEGTESAGTVVVLGCKIINKRPSLTLKGRLDAAYEYLDKNKDTVAIVSGGQGWDEETSEASVMKKYLVDKGIEEHRIIMEEKAVNTDENIKFSGEIIKENNLPETMYIVTDTFHSYRGYLFAEKNGYEAKNISSDIYWPLFGEYWVRDILGILHMKLTPNWELDIQNS